MPGLFCDLAGIEVAEFDVPPHSVAISGQPNGTSSQWCDIIIPKTARVLSRYAQEYYKGQAAITVNQYGSGKVYYVGCDLDDGAMKQLASLIASDAGIDMIKAPEHVEIIKRDKYIAVLNHNDCQATIPLQGYDLVSEQ